MIFSEKTLSELRESVSRYMGEKRFRHTLGVEEAAAFIGKILLCDRIYELRCAALLHDVAKELSSDELLSLAKAGGCNLTNEDYNTPAALHSFAAPALILRDFAQYSSDDILSSAAFHTLGDPGMSLFDKIIFISDFIEDGRKYASCMSVREYLYNNLSLMNSQDANERILNRALVMAIDYTISNLESRGLSVNSRTRSTKKALLDII